MNSVIWMDFDFHPNVRLADAEKLAGEGKQYYIPKQEY
jgi:hypothetical protein